MCLVSRYFIFLPDLVVASIIERVNDNTNDGDPSVGLVLQYITYKVSHYYIIKHICGSVGDQGRSCKQICWPPGVGGLQRVGLAWAAWSPSP